MVSNKIEHKICFYLQSDNIICVPKKTPPLVCDPPCIMGICISNKTTGLGHCKCDPFFTGDTCDYYTCHTFCYNNGICYVEPGSNPEIDIIAKVNYYLHLFTVLCIII